MNSSAVDASSASAQLRGPKPVHHRDTALTVRGSATRQRARLNAL